MFDADFRATTSFLQSSNAHNLYENSAVQRFPAKWPKLGTFHPLFLGQLDTFTFPASKQGQVITRHLFVCIDFLVGLNFEERQTK